MKIKILYEDKDVLVIDKPSGISVHPAVEQAHYGAGPDGKIKNKEETISDWFVKKYPKAKNVGEPIFVDGKEIKKPGIVHRLDKETSGVLILVKNQKAYDFLKNQFKNREIKKVYNTIVLGLVKNDRGVIRKPIGRSGNDFRKRLAGRGARGELREAITEYTVLKRFTSPQPSPTPPNLPLSGETNGFPLTRGSKGVKGEGVKFTYLEVRPKTGRTHQIRVHMKFINHPVVCDSLYNPNQPFPEGFKRLGLHAKSIEFNLPAGRQGDLKGKILKVESPLPKEFKKHII